MEVASLIAATNSKPDYFVDNDQEKWGKKLLGKEILSPKEFRSIDKKLVTVIVITTSYLKDVLPQIKDLVLMLTSSKYPQNR